MIVDGGMKSRSVPRQAPYSLKTVQATQRPLRVAFVSYEYPPHEEGGAGVYAGCLVRELVTLGHSVSVFTPNRGQGRRAGAVIPVGRDGTRAAGYWAALPTAMVQAMHRVGPFDLIHGNAIADLSLSRYIFSAPRVVTLHHVTRRIIPPGFAGISQRLRDYRGETGIGPSVERIVLGRADRVICVSEPVRNDALRLCGLRSSQVTVIPNGRSTPGRPDPSLVAALRKTYCNDSDSLLLTVGRQEYRKGTSVLLQAFSQLAARDNICLVLVGDGPTDQYRDLAGTLGIEDRVFFTGRVSDEIRDALYSACDIFVSAALHEGFGLTVFEAMAMGKPVIVTETGAAAGGWVSQQHGAVVPPGSVGSLRDALSRLLVSASERRTLGAANSAYAERLPDWRQVALETQNVYWSALKDQRPGIAKRITSSETRYSSVREVK